MVDGQKKKDGWLDGQKTYMKRWMVGWIKKQMDGWMDMKKRWMVAWKKKLKKLMDGGWIKKNKKIDGQLDGYKHI